METLTSSISKTTLPPMASTGFSSMPTLFTLKSLLNPGLSLQSKPIKLQLSHSLSSSFSTHLALSPLQRKRLSPSIVSCVAETTSAWAEQDDQGGDSPTALQDLEQSSEEEESIWDGPEASLSDWEETGGEVEAAAGTEEEGEEVVEEEQFSEPPEDAKLFVGNLPYDVDSESLARLFEPAGVVEISEVIYNRDTDQSRGFGFVTMSTVEEADKAVEMFNRYDLNGRFLTVNKAAPRGTRPERTPRNFGNNNPAFRLYVGNLPWDTDNGRLEQVFSEYGRVVDARVVFDRETGRSRGFGFVTMSTQSEVNDAIAALDGQTLDGRTVRVNVAEERPRRSF